MILPFDTLPTETRVAKIYANPQGVFIVDNEGVTWDVSEWMPHYNGESRLFSYSVNPNNENPNAEALLRLARERGIARDK